MTIRAILTSKLSSSTTEGEPRYIALLVENRMRNLAQAGENFMLDVLGTEDRMKDVAMLKAYLAGVQQELKMEALITVKETP
jgi:hypothetical protein